MTLGAIATIAGVWAAIVGSAAGFLVLRRAIWTAQSDPLDTETKHLAIMFGWIPLALIGAFIAAVVGGV